MKYLALLLSVMCASCMHNLSYQTDVIDSTGKSLEVTTLPAHADQNHIETGNRNLWQLIEQSPDSVAVAVAVNDSLQAVLTISGILDTSYFEPKTIRVAFTNNQTQEIKVKGNVVLWQEGRARPYLKMEDVNFDGYADLHVFDNDGAGGNFWYSIWLYDKERKLFVFSKGFTDISSLKPDISSKQLIGYYQWNGCQENVTYFKLIKNQPEPVKYVFGKEEKQGDETLCIGYEKKLIGKTWKTTKLGELDVSLYDSLYNQVQ
jgi:hypothetical protein